MKVITLIYDPVEGQPIPDSKVVSSVSSFLDVFKREVYFKSTFGNFRIIEEFIRQSVERGISLDNIAIIYKIAGQEITINTSNDPSSY